MPENIDNPNANTDNAGIHDVNGAVYINMSDQTPLNDPACKHKDVVKDPTEELGDAYYCQNCHVGWIVTVSS